MKPEAWLGVVSGLGSTGLRKEMNTDWERQGAIAVGLFIYLVIKTILS